MAFNINDLNAQIGKHGVQKGNLFRMTITPPPGLVGVQLPTAMESRDLQFFCRAVTLPEFDVQTDEVQPQAFGPVVRRPRTLNFPVLTAVFTVDGDMKVPSYFHRWTQLIINYDNTSQYGSLNGALPFEMGYKQEYATTIIVDVYNEYGEDIYTYKFKNAYPINVGQVETAWANNDEALTQSVGFSYDILSVTGASVPRPGLGGSRDVDVVNPFSSTGAPGFSLTSDSEQRLQAAEERNYTEGKVLTKRGWRYPLGQSEE